MSVFGDSRRCKLNWMRWLGICPSMNQLLGSMQTLVMIGHAILGTHAVSTPAILRYLSPETLRNLQIVHVENPEFFRGIAEDIRRIVKWCPWNSKRVSAES